MHYLGKQTMINSTQSFKKKKKRIRKSKEITRANVSTRNNRFPFDCTSWEICLQCNCLFGKTEAKEADNGSHIEVEAPSPLNPVINSLVSNRPHRLQAAAAAIRFRQKKKSPNCLKTIRALKNPPMPIPPRKSNLHPTKRHATINEIRRKNYK